MAYDLSATVGQRVVRLPTAPRRQVRQSYSRAWYAKAEALRAAQPWPGKYIYPSIREKMAEAELLDDIEPTPALALACAIHGALRKDEKERVNMILAIAAAAGRRTFAQAAALIGAEKRTIGENNDLQQALAIIRGER